MNLKLNKKLSKFNKNDLFPLKGRFGELVYKGYLIQNFGWVCEENDELQKAGVDFIVRTKDGIEIRKVDVKLTDTNPEYFSIAYSKNGNSQRFPNRDGCKADRLCIVSCLYDKYIQDNQESTRSLFPTEEQAIDKLSEFMSKEDSDHLISTMREKDKKKKDKTFLGDLHDLIIAHQVCNQLEKEINSGSFSILNTILQNYITSIDEIPFGMILDLLRGFENFRDGQVTYDKNGTLLAAKRDKYTRYGLYTAAEIGWNAVETINIYKKKTVLESPALEKAWPYPYSVKANIPINEKGNRLHEMNKDSLLWLQNENKNKKSTFYSKVFALSSSQELDSLITNLLENNLYKTQNTVSID